jgi:lysozyme
MSSTNPDTSLLSVAGIDVSHHQGEVNWHAVAESGITFAFAKATEGSAFVDPQFNRNWTGMKDASIVRGAYHFFRPTQPVEPQIANVLKAINDFDDGDLPPVLDLEEAQTPNGDEWESVHPKNRVSLVSSWLDGVASRLGRKPIIYTRRGFVEMDLPDATALGQFPLWIAHYTAGPAPRVPSVWSKWTFWQYSDGGKVNGISGHVDLNRFSGAPTELHALAASGN